MSKNTRRKLARYGGLSRAQNAAKRAKHLVHCNGSDEHTSNLYRRCLRLQDRLQARIIELMK